jgi:hypothetical protein
LQRSQRYDLDGHVRWLCRPFVARPSKSQWQALVGDLLALHEQVGLSLVAIDPLAHFFPIRSENHADSMLEALLPLQRLTTAGLAALVLHHPRKHASPDGQSARGSGALCGHVDILLEMHWESAGEESRRRNLLAWSRHEATPRHRLIELSADGRDYLVVTDPEADVLLPLREALWRFLESVPTKQTRADILDNWPPDHPKPSPVTLWRLLERCVGRGELKRDGAGLKSDPFRYWLPSLEERWERDPVARLQQTIADAQRDARLKFDRVAFKGCDRR